MDGEKRLMLLGDELPLRFWLCFWGLFHSYRGRGEAASGGRTCRSGGALSGVAVWGIRGGFGQELHQISPSVNFDFPGVYVRTMSLTPAGFGRLNGYVRTAGISACCWRTL